MTEKWALDLFCGAGGATKGYQRLGLKLQGVDIKSQPRYCGERFAQEDALEYLRRIIDNGDVRQYILIHASPPCQKYSKTQRIMGNYHSDLIGPTRELLSKTDCSWVIENVKGSPLQNPTLLVGAMFGLLTYRPRLFETQPQLPLMLVPPIHNRQLKMGRKPKDGDLIHVVGNFSGVEYARMAMGIDWMVGRELAEAIPPAYTEFIGRMVLSRCSSSER